MASQRNRQQLERPCPRTHVVWGSIADRNGYRA